jgi:hypothetical protein
MSVMHQVLTPPAVWPPTHSFITPPAAVLLAVEPRAGRNTSLVLRWPLTQALVALAAVSACSKVTPAAPRADLSCGLLTAACSYGGNRAAPNGRVVVASSALR